MARKKKLEVELGDELDSELNCMAAEAGTTTADILRRGLAVLKAKHMMHKVGGPQHLGFVADASKLDVEILNVL